MIHGDSAKPSADREIPLWRKILFAGIVLIAFFGCAELLARTLWHPKVTADAVGTRKFVTWLSEIALGDESPLDLYVTDAKRLWRLNSGRSFRTENYHRATKGEVQPVEITINAHGYRGKMYTPAEANAARFAVLCLGDSNFFGYPLDDRHAFPFVLEQAIEQRTTEGEACVINAGVPGYSSTQGRLWYDEEFAEQRFNWFLVSFLNNDAWAQPKSDRELLSHPPSEVALLAQSMVVHSRLLQAVQAAVPRSTSTNDYVARVCLAEYQANIEYFVEQARRHDAQLLFIDYRVYNDYSPYSHVLAEMAQNQPSVHYFYVLDRVTEAFNAGRHLTRYKAQAETVRRRWSEKTLQENPRLWFYAEFHPEHLNEVGTAWLADQVADLMLLASDR